MSRVCKPTRDKPMSYILDALKRANAERERGAVPGLHARQLTTPITHNTDNVRHRRWLAAAGVSLALGGVAAGGWIFHQPTPANPGPTAAPVPQPAPAAVLAPVPAWQTTVAPARAASAAPTLANAPTKSNPVPASPAAAIALPTAAAAATPAIVPLLSELSDDLRRDIPKLTITGTVYAESPGQRLLLVNGLVLTQGSQAAPDVTLEEIRAKSAVFSFRGTRFRVMQ